MRTSGEGGHGGSKEEWLDEPEKTTEPEGFDHLANALCALADGAEEPPERSEMVDYFDAFLAVFDNEEDKQVEMWTDFIALCKKHGADPTQRAR